MNKFLYRIVMTSIFHQKPPKTNENLYFTYEDYQKSY